MDTDLPEPPSSPPRVVYHRQTRSKKRRALDIDSGFPSSDGPTFSSDPPEPAVDEQRRKRQHRGTWWSYGNDIHPPKSNLSRNFDSGIHLPSDSSEDSELNAATVSLEAHSYQSRRVAASMVPEAEDPLQIAARSMVNDVVEKDGRYVDME
jgi:hypothetical protein